MAADLILRNFRTPDPALELLAVRGRHIVYAGAVAAFDALRGAQTHIIDCDGGWLLPGFNDAHCHPLAHALTLRQVDCGGAGVNSIAGVQAALRAAAVQRPGQSWLRAARCDPSRLLEGRLPDRGELDAAVPDRPLLLVAHDGQRCALNSRALSCCGIAADCPDGIVAGNDERVARALPPPDDAEIEAGLRAASRDYLSRGITSLTDTSWSNTVAHWQMLQLFKQRDLFAPRLSMLAGIDAIDAFAQQGLRSGAGNAQLRLAGVKLALDESRGGCTQAELDALALHAHRAGFQLAFHVPDIELLRLSLRALAHVRAEAGSVLRPRFEHCPLCPPQLLPELAHSGAVVVSQPNLLWQTGPAYLREATAEQLGWVFPYRSFLAAGIPLAFSSDSPLTPCDPLAAIKTAVTRQVEGGAQLAADEAITPAQAIDAYTWAGAWASGEETEKGRLAPGQLADLVLLDGNSPAAARVRLTLLDGRVVWARDDATFPLPGAEFSHTS